MTADEGSERTRMSHATVRALVIFGLGVKSFGDKLVRFLPLRWIVVHVIRIDLEL